MPRLKSKIKIQFISSDRWPSFSDAKFLFDPVNIQFNNYSARFLKKGQILGVQMWSLSFLLCRPLKMGSNLVFGYVLVFSFGDAAFSTQNHVP